MSTTADLDSRVAGRSKTPKPKPPKPKRKKIKPKRTQHAFNRPWNRYIIYFKMEREKLIMAKGGSTEWSKSSNEDDDDDDTNPKPENANTANNANTAKSSKKPTPTGEYDDLTMPPLPKRFAHLTVPRGWYIPDLAHRRPHRKSHGVTSSRELAKMIAESWKEVDDETLEWCMAVEKVGFLYIVIYSAVPFCVYVFSPFFPWKESFNDQKRVSPLPSFFSLSLLRYSRSDTRIWDHARIAKKNRLVLR